MVQLASRYVPRLALWNTAVIPLPPVVMVGQPEERDPQPDNRHRSQEDQDEHEGTVHLREVDEVCLVPP